MAKNDCVICISEAAQAQYDADKLEPEKFSDIQQYLRWKIEAEPHRKRIVCSRAHYEKMMEWLREIKRDNDKPQPKCLRHKCGHTERMHPQGGACSARNCKCVEFSKVETVPEFTAATLEGQQEDKVAMSFKEWQKEFRKNWG
jgi:hypothetical protein